MQNFRVWLMFILFSTLAFVNMAQGQQKLDSSFSSPLNSVKAMSRENYPDAPYVFANNDVHISFDEADSGIVAVVKHHARIKVFDASNPEASVISIPYYFKNNMEKIKGLKGYTSLPSGKKVSLQKGDIRIINLNDRYNIKEVTMPAVEDGAVLDYQYIIRRRYIEQLPDFRLSKKVPTSEASVTITYPNYLRYKPYFENISFPLSHNVSYKDTSSVPKIFTLPRPAPILTEQWKAHDIPAVKKEPYISSLDDYRAKIKFMLSAFGIPRQQLDDSWAVTVAKLRKRNNPLVRIQQNRLAKTQGDSIAGSHAAMSKDAVQDSIYRFLNERANFSGDNTPYSDAPDSVVLAGKPIDQASINQTLVAMLRGAGIEAYPVFISGRKYGSIDKNFPSALQLNSQLAWSRIGDQTYLMDASFPHSSPGLIPVNMYNGPGLLLKGRSFDWIDITPPQSKFSNKVDIKASLHTDGSLSGHVVSSQAGYSAQRIRKQKTNGKTDAQILKSTLFEGYAKLTLRNVKVKNLHDYGRPIKITADFKIEKYAIAYTDGLRFRPMVVGYLQKNPFEDSQRSLPVTFDAPETLKLSYHIKLPNGYQLETYKNNQLMGVPGARFEEDYNLDKDRLNYSFNIDIARKTFSTSHFTSLFQLYQRWVKISKGSWLVKR